MSSWTKRLIALILWVPFGVYAGREITLVADRSAPPVADAKLPNGDKAAQGHAAAKQAAAVAKTDIQAVALFAPGGGPFKGVLSQRAAAVENARLFLESGTATTTFSGDWKDEFKSAFDADSVLRDGRLKVEAWFDQPVPAEAAGHLTNFLDTVFKPYIEAKPSPTEAAGFELRARHRVAMAFAAELGKRYDAALEAAPLPLPKGDDLPRDVTALLKMFREFRTLHTARPAPEQQTPSVKSTAAEMTAAEGDWTARGALLTLFAAEPTGLSPADGGKWLGDVNAQLVKLKQDGTRAAARGKVQQFCAAFLPKKFALDSQVLVSKSPVPRADVKVRYQRNGTFEEPFPKLTDDPDGLNESTADSHRPGSNMNMFYMDSKGSVDPKSVKPTDKSLAAFKYKDARSGVPEKNGWTASRVAQLVEKAGPPADPHPWDELSLIGRSGEYKVYQRLKVVEDAMTKLPALFETKTP